MHILKASSYSTVIFTNNHRKLFTNPFNASQLDVLKLNTVFASSSRNFYSPSTKVGNAFFDDLPGIVSAATSKLNTTYTHVAGTD